MSVPSPTADLRVFASAPASSRSGGFFAHHGIWAPGVRSFRHLRFGAKASLISFAFVVPLALLAWSFFSTKYQSVVDTRNERAGVEFARDLLPAIKHARQLRRFTLAEASSGKPSAELADVRSKLVSELGTVRHTDERLGDALGTRTLVAGLEDALKSAEPASAGVSKVLDSHNKFNAVLLNTLEKVADGSGLMLDPELDTYYLMDAGLVAGPLLLEQTARMRVLASSVARTGQGKESALQELLREDGLAEYAAVHLQNDIQKVVGVHPEMKTALDTGATALGVAELRSLAVKASVGSADAALADSLERSGAVVVKSLEELQAHLVDALDQQLSARENVLKRQMLGTAAILALCAAAAGYMFFSFFLVMSGGLNEVRRHLGLMAAGDLTSSPTPWGKDDAADLMNSLRGTQLAMRRIVTQVREASDGIVVASTEISNGARDLSARTEQSAANLQESAAAMEQITSTVQQTAGGANQASELATKNEQAATRGGEIIGTMVSTMQRIHASSNKIGDIIGTIDGIAFQTNILALNAAVEAARAGDAGRGFAVVASEVRALAQRTSTAAREIKGLISVSVEEVASGASVASTAGATMDDIVRASEQVNRLLTEIATGANEQARGVSQTSQAVQELDNVQQQNAALVEETAAAAASLHEQAKALAGEVAQFKLPA